MEADLHEALIAWQGGELPPGRTEMLLARMHTDADFRRAFAEQVWTLSLTRIAQAPDPRWLALQEELELSATVQDATDGGDLENAVMETIRAEPVRFVAAWWRRAAYGAIAASVALAAALAIWSLRPARVETKPAAATPTLAVLVQEENTVWKSPLPVPPAASRSLGAERLQLGAGRATLLFTSGVILDFEGPADLQLVSVDRVICRGGRLRTKVPKGAEGFCVETPRGAVTDLGTELGISVAPDGKTSVAVFEGQAEVSLQIPGQQGVRTALLNKSDTAELQPTTGEIRPDSRESFLPAASLRLPPLSLPPAYAETIQAARPREYWRLNRLQDGAAPNEIAGAPALRFAGQAGLEADESGRVSAVFRGRKQPGVLYLDQPWIKPEKDYAIEMWFAADSVALMSLVALTIPDTHFQHVALVETGSRRPSRGPEAGVLRYLTRWPASDRGGMNIYSQPVALPYRWHHLVAQQTGVDLELFLDGLSIGTAQASAFAGAIPCALQFGCLAYDPAADLGRLQRFFSGRLAEIAIYDRLLMPEEIRQHGRR